MCLRCQDRMAIIAFIQDDEFIKKILKHLGFIANPNIRKVAVQLQQWQRSLLPTIHRNRWSEWRVTDRQDQAEYTEGVTIMKRLRFYFLYFLPFVFVLLTNPAAADTITLYPAADTMISERWPSDIYGAGTGLMVGRTSNAEPNACHSRIRFSGIPSGAKIQSAVLRLYRTMGNGSHTLSVQSASSSWNESTLTWNSPGSTNRYSTPNSVR